jgi:hypothetical protein
LKDWWKGNPHERAYLQIPPLPSNSLHLHPIPAASAKWPIFYH